jgi:hypothetical protein
MKLISQLKTSLTLLLLVCSVLVQAQSLEKRLEKLSQSYPIEIKKMEADSFFTEKFQITFTQPLDHFKAGSKLFKQRIYLSHKGFTRPVVLVTDGYWASYAARSKYVNELCPILNANQVVVEHRYFPPSAPDSLDWRYLTVKQAAADDHAIVELLKQIYPTKWINTGISKGGQTCMYHRYFYPDDVVASVAYVAPLNFSITDKRINRFFKTVGTKLCRDAIYQFQKELISHRAQYLPAFISLANQKGYTYRMGYQKAFDLMVFEYPFAFWQWGVTACDSIPKKGASAQKMIAHLDKVADLSWVSDQGIKKYEAFFYEAMHEMGMYGYDITPFKAWTVFKKNPDFRFTLPEGAQVDFDPALMEKVDCFIRHKATNMMFIVGGSDPWGSTSVDLTYQTNSVKFVKPGGSHRTRINNLPPNQKQKAIQTLKSWIESGQNEK